MNDWPKTLSFAAVATATTALALGLSVLDNRRANRLFDDQGETFFAAFKDPLEAQAMEVVEYNPDTATVTPFNVQQKGGKWSIPSHYDYPAEAKDRLAKTASGLIDLKKDTIRSDDVADHEKLGVIDPLDTKASSLTGRGKRVTLRKQAEGEVLADLIIGNAVKDRPNQRFVRLPSNNRTYAVNLNLDLSTRFADWITQDLLKLESNRIRKIVIDRHRADPTRGMLIPGEITTLTRDSAPNSWSIDNPDPVKKVNTSKVGEITNALSGLKILGTRPKPAGLTKDLKESEDGKFKLSQQAMVSLQQRGFYRTRQGTLVSNQGEIQVGTDQGVVYVMRFGEVTVADGEDLSAGTSDDAKPDDKQPEPKSKSAESEKARKPGTEGRFLFITATFDPSLIPAPTDPLSNRVEFLPGDPFQHTTSGVTTQGFEPDVADEQKRVKEKADKLEAEMETKRAEGRKLVEQLSSRYASWYYVVSGDSFRTVAADRSAFLQEPGETSPSAAPAFNPAGLPGF